MYTNSFVRQTDEDSSPDIICTNSFAEKQMKIPVQIEAYDGHFQIHNSKKKKTLNKKMVTRSHFKPIVTDLEAHKVKWQV